MDNYDEDVNENQFFQDLNYNIDNFEEKAATKQWIVCVPQSGHFLKCSFQLEDFENHILVKTNEDESSYKTLNGKSVLIRDACVITGDDFTESQSIPILFEETFYLKDGKNFQILCVDRIFDRFNSGEFLTESLTVKFELNTLKDCVDLLYREVGDQRIHRLVDEYVETWNADNQNLEFDTIQSMRDLASALYTNIFQAILKDIALKKKVWGDNFLMDSLKLAVETFTMHGVYKRVMKGLTAYLAREDAQLNKIVRNLSDLQLKDLNVNPEFVSSLPKAKQELSRIDWYTTPLDKIGCIKRAVASVLKTTSVHPTAMATDDLLPILVFLVLKIGMPNWLAHLNFMKNFRLSQINDDGEKDEFGYYIASLEAAIEHIRSGILWGSSTPEGIPDSSSPKNQRINYIQENTSIAIKNFFDLVREGNHAAVCSILSKSNISQQKVMDDLCHPLCSCDCCESKQKQNSYDVHPTLQSRDDKGCTALHAASECGQDLVVEGLISLKADVNATDYRGCSPLHLACQRGHQNATLMLLHHGALLNVTDNDGNTPLHLCALNGHEDCVKALLYSDEFMYNSTIQLNANNDSGDTPLHFAARWGYAEIVEILLEFGACIASKNKRQQTPLDCSHNTNVSRFLEKAQEGDQVKTDGFVILKSCSLPHVATVMVPEMTKEHSCSPAYTPSSVLSARKFNKLMKATAAGDVNLVCFYLGLDYESDSLGLESEDSESTTLCHPLCQCKKCVQLQKVPRYLPSPKSDVTVNSSAPDGKTPLYVACSRGYPLLTKILLENGANPNARTTHQGFSPLHVACQNGHVEVVKLLLKFDASVNIGDSLGRSPLHLCCLNRHLSLATILLKNSANANQHSHDGNTPLHEAARCNEFPLVDLLIQSGADSSITNRNRLTAFDLSTDASVKRLLHHSNPLLVGYSALSSRVSISDLKTVAE